MQMIGFEETVNKDVFKIMFAQFDKDDSGEIEKSELYEFIEGLTKKQSGGKKNRPQTSNQISSKPKINRLKPLWAKIAEFIH